MITGKKIKIFVDIRSPEDKTVRQYNISYQIEGENNTYYLYIGKNKYRLDEDGKIIETYLDNTL